LEYARVVARAFRTEHHEVLVEPSDFAAASPSTTCPPWSSRGSTCGLPP
jgi:asparagine synthetase B (glutamine-hydrolysing)